MIFLSVCTTKIAVVYHVSRRWAIHHYFISMQHHNLRRGEGFMIHLPSQKILNNGYGDRLLLGRKGIKSHYYLFVRDRLVAHVSGSSFRIIMPRALLRLLTFHMLQSKSVLGLRTEQSQCRFTLFSVASFFETLCLCFFSNLVITCCITNVNRGGMVNV